MKLFSQILKGSLEVPEPRAKYLYSDSIKFGTSNDKMPTSDETLLIAIISQLKDYPVNFKILAQDLGTPTAGAAQQRWRRYRKRLLDKQTAITHRSSKPSGVQKNKASPSKNDKKDFTETMHYDDDDGDDAGEVVKEEIPNTPTRKMPSRKARVVDFTIYCSEDEDEEEIKKEKQILEEEETAYFDDWRETST